MPIKRISKRACGLGLCISLALIAGCGGGGSSSSLTPSDATCIVSSSGNQALSYTLSSPGSTSSTINETLPYSYSWSCTTSARSLTGNGVPNHAVTYGVFATKISAQSVSFSAPYSPTKLTTTTTYTLQSPGYAINSVKFDPQTNGGCPSSAQSASNCNYANNPSGYFNMVAKAGNTSPWQFDFGVDTSNAHVQPGGIYHYHGVPTGLVSKLNTNAVKAMTLVGWANDGYPIYDQYGDSTSTSGTSTLSKVTSGWTTKTSPSSGRPSTTYFAMGHFEEDWEFTGTVTGALDKCNGHTGATSEFPSGTYHYHLTETYPFVQRCVYGKVN